MDDKEGSYYLQELYRMISKLGKMERALILLWLDERPYQEISDILGISLTNVGTRLNRVKEKLKEMSNN
jgi:RNA polymerase sigma-70 factor (ECF subfamily)